MMGVAPVARDSARQSVLSGPSPISRGETVASPRSGSPGPATATPPNLAAVPAPPADASPSGPLETAEAEAIRAALARTGGHRTRAATELGISRNTLWRKMKRYGLS